MNDLLFSFYGDDFTGSTDAMECLELNGIPAVLFLEPPTREQVEQNFPRVRAVGVAGVSRSMTPQQMDEALPPAFEALKRLGAPFVHYKVCSTFDSSAAIGSIGRAIDIGFQVFEPQVVPLAVGAPFLRRYVAFGNLFARVGDVTYRLDRHPTMSRHPTTPMTEADLREHLGAQTRRRIELVDLYHMSGGGAEVDARIERLVSGGAEIILFDTMDADHMREIGRVVWGMRRERPVFLAGSSSIEYSLGMHLQSIGVVEEPQNQSSAGETSQIVVLSGSCAPGTAEQISFAEKQGFAALRLDGAKLVDPATAEAERQRAVKEALELIDAGQSVILYSARGPDDPAITATNARLTEAGLDPSSVGQRLGSEQGRILRAILEKSALRRVCVAGGDTCGHAAHQLGIYALEMITPIAPGAPLCRASSSEERFDGLQISLKGGQNGSAEYFLQIRNGEANGSTPSARM